MMSEGGVQLPQATVGENAKSDRMTWGTNRERARIRDSIHHLAVYKGCRARILRRLEELARFSHLYDASLQ
jgi:hypothetical protein